MKYLKVAILLFLASLCWTINDFLLIFMFWYWEGSRLKKDTIFGDIALKIHLKIQKYEQKN